MPETPRTLEDERIARAEVLAVVAAQTAATLASHESRLNAVNGHIRDYGIEAAKMNTHLATLQTSLDDIQLDLRKREEVEDQNRRSVKVALYTIAGTIVTSGLGGLIAYLLG